MSRLVRFFRLRGDERRRLVAAGLRLLMVRALLDLVGAARTRTILSRRVRRLADVTDAGGVASEIAQLVDRAARNLPLKTNCLDRSFALWWTLATHGIESEVRIGVKRDAEFEAHAWVEQAGVALLDDSVSHFERLEPPFLSGSAR